MSASSAPSITGGNDAAVDATTEPPAAAFPMPSKLRINALMYLPVATGCLSLIGSSLILLSIYRSRINQQPSSHSKRQTSPVYHRILGVMSVYDIVYTLFSSMFGVLFLPHESLTYRRGHGTRFTCTLQGFFIQWGFGCFAYGAWLSVYYVLTIRYNLPEATLARYVEPMIHASVFLFYFGTALIASAVGLMNPTGSAVCWIIPYPNSCTYDGVPCVRGANYKQAILSMILVPSCFSVVVILVCLAIVALTVWQQRNIVRQQRQRLALHTGRSFTDACQSTITMLQGTDSSFAIPSGVIAGEPEPQPQQTSRPAPAASGNQAKLTSSVDRLTNEAIGQCIFSGCTFVNSVIWINLVYGYFIEGNSAGKDLYWVRPRPRTFDWSSDANSSAHLLYAVIP
jgi:hypothetical protein